MYYRFTNIDKNRTSTFRDRANNGQNLMGGDKFEEYNTIKLIEGLLEVPSLPIQWADDNETLCISLTQENVDLMMHNLRKSNLARGQGSLFKTIQALKPGKITTAG